MSTDWTTNQNISFGVDELYLKLSDAISGVFSNLGYLDIKREDLYSLYKKYNVCPGNCKWELYDRYKTSNDYTRKFL